MAETTKQLYDRILEAAATDPTLLGLGTGLPTYEQFCSALDRGEAAAFPILASVIAQVQVDTLSVPFDRHRAEVDALTLRQIAANDAYLVDYMLRFQLGDQVERLASGRPGYAVVDATKQIIKYVSVESRNGQARVKVAKSTDNAPVPLSVAELNQARDYLRAIYAPGADWVLRSLPADTLKLEGAFYYNGEVGLSAFRTNLQNRIVTYLRQGQFGGMLRLNGSPSSPGLIDDLQANVPGFRAPDVRAFIRSAVNPTWREFRLQAALESGFAVFALSDSTLTYIAE